MNLLGFLKDIPISLLLSSLTLAAAAAPVQGTALELTPDTFKGTTGKGLWFIEHFSPYCGHCKNFKPTWEQLVSDSVTEIPEVKTGTINCIDYGDLCNENGIAGYPTILMFEDGKKVGEFKGARDMDKLKTFMKSFVKEAPPPPPKEEPKPKKPTGPILNPTGDVTILDDKTFDSVLGQGPAFIKFYAPWCGHCKKLAPIWKQLGRHMQGKLTIAEVNCDENSKLCAKNGIEGYPTLLYIGGAEGKRSRNEYSGGRKLDQLKAFAEKASTAGIQPLEKDDDLVSHLEKESVVYVLLHDGHNEEVLDNIREAASPLLGSPVIYSSSSPELFKRFRVSTSTPWALVVLKDNDVKSPISIFKGSKSVQEDSDKLGQWLLTNRLPISLELTQDTFQEVMKAPQAPLVVIAAAPKDDTLRKKIGDRMTELGKKWRLRTDGTGKMNGREVVFTFMDAQKWAEWMKSMYGIKYEDKEHGDAYSLEDVKVVIADHSRLIYYDGDHSGKPIKFTSTNDVFAAIDDAVNKKSAFKHSESFVERSARYLNNKMSSVEVFVSTKPFHAIGIFLVFMVALFYVITKLVAGVPQDPEHMFRDYKGKNGRLD